jgi:hypothetical protein
LSAGIVNPIRLTECVMAMLPLALNLLEEMESYIMNDETPSYHDLHVTLPDMERASIFNLPYGIEVTCMRTTGWRVYMHHGSGTEPELLGGEYDNKPIRVDVAGFVVCDSFGKVLDDE